MSKYKIGLFGFGCVGKGLYETLTTNNNLDVEISKICVKNKNKDRSPISSEKFTFSADEILNDDSINVVVELIDDAEAAYEIVTKSLKNGKAVVTANKKMVAEHLPELIALQKEYNTTLLYEGAVCGSIPVIRNLNDYYASEQITEVKGIFNGSSNYILTKLFQEGQSYDEALKEAQENGFAETDPTLDVGGFDPKFKLSIIIQHAFGISVSPEKIFNWGIQNISDEDIRFAKERDLKIKLVAKATSINDQLSLLVAPHYVDRENPLYHVENEFNCVLINGKYAQDQTLIGKGAGSLPTGLAVLADIASLTKEYTYSYSDSTLLSVEESLSEVYLRFDDIDGIDLSVFEEISEKFVGQHHGYVIGKISLTHLKAILKDTKGAANVIFTSGKSAEIELSKLTYSYA
ncbi:homoserine dehydrogenase [Fulvivirga sediminis]|uniref:Homoserine dehydrogenase n=1 Tax=Fulvivirga sediminis TaxID=2803949 RepID=A0A937F8D9_9BACT|nr:homoserine dehydrogenase [Fulvivirga sediminis]MBL3657031.1 homoserine dehydrogenase [Fulvivirga sediminis]